jgi:hypothetical protein
VVQCGTGAVVQCGTGESDGVAMGESIRWVDQLDGWIN